MCISLCFLRTAFVLPRTFLSSHKQAHCHCPNYLCPWSPHHTSQTPGSLISNIVGVITSHLPLWPRAFMDHTANTSRTRCRFPCRGEEQLCPLNPALTDCHKEEKSAFLNSINDGTCLRSSWHFIQLNLINLCEDQMWLGQFVFWKMLATRGFIKIMTKTPRKIDSYFSAPDLCPRPE